MAHARLSASQAKRWMGCPGSVRLIEAMPRGARRGSSEASRLGTAAHALLEACLASAKQNGFDEAVNGPRVFVGVAKVIVAPDEEGGEGRMATVTERTPEGHYAYPVDDDMADAVSVAYGEVRDLMERYPWADLRLESRASLDDYGPDLGGTADIVVDAWPDALYVLDYKHGAGVTVEVEENHQTRTYILAEAHASGFTHSRYVTGIVQPRRRHDDGSVRTEELTAEELTAFGASVRAARKLVDDPDAPLVLGDHCTWCDARTSCPAQIRAAQEQAQVDFMEPWDGTPLPVPEDLPSLGQLMGYVPALEALCKRARQLAHEALARGEAVPGYKLVRGKQGNRQWKADPEEIARAASVLGMPDQMWEPRRIRSPAQIEKLGKEWKALLKANEADWVERPPGRVAMAPEGDPRPAVEVDPSFGELDFDGGDGNE